MEYILFVKKVEQLVKKKLGNSYTVRHESILKNNGLELDALIIMKKNDIMSPNIYLECYYKSFCDGITLTEICDKIIKDYHSALSKCPISKDDYTDFDKIQNKIYYRLINYEKNKVFLEQVPHIPYMDLAITFHCKVEEDKNGLQSYCITNHILKKWNLTLSELEDIAKKNTPQLFKPHITTMEQLLQKLCIEPLFDDFYDWKDDVNYETLLNSLEECDTIPMYIITNQSGVNGAACILYPNLLKHLAEKFCSNLFLLPSSIHECIIVPETNHKEINYQKEELTKMVQEVNETQVSVDEMLGEHVYYYDLEQDSLSY